MPLPKKYRKKYEKKPAADEQVVFFAARVVVITASLFVVAVGIDAFRIYRMLF